MRNFIWMLLLVSVLKLPSATDAQDDITYFAYDIDSGNVYSFALDSPAERTLLGTLEPGLFLNGQRLDAMTAIVNSQSLVDSDYSARFHLLTGDSIEPIDFSEVFIDLSPVIHAYHHPHVLFTAFDVNATETLAVVINVETNERVVIDSIVTLESIQLSEDGQFVRYGITSVEDGAAIIELDLETATERDVIRFEGTGHAMAPDRYGANWLVRSTDENDVISFDLFHLDGSSQTLGTYSPGDGGMRFVMDSNVIVGYEMFECDADCVTEVYNPDGTLLQTYQTPGFALSGDTIALESGILTSRNPDSEILFIEPAGTITSLGYYAPQFIPGGLPVFSNGRWLTTIDDPVEPEGYQIWDLTNLTMVGEDELDQLLIMQPSIGGLIINPGANDKEAKFVRYSDGIVMTLPPFAEFRAAAATMSGTVLGAPADARNSLVEYEPATGETREIMSDASLIRLRAWQ